MIRLAAGNLQLICDICTEAALLRVMPDEFLRLTRESVGALQIRAIGVQDTPATAVARAVAMSNAAVEATDELPEGWERETIDGWPWLVCPSCSRIGARAEAPAATTQEGGQG